MKRARKKLPNGITKVGDRYQASVYDSTKTRHRKLFDTPEEAAQYRAEIKARKATGGSFLARSTAHTLGEAFDELLKDKGAASRHKPSIETQGHGLRARFGHWPLDHFVRDRCAAVADYMTELRDRGLSKQTMDHYKSALKLAFDAAIQHRDRWLDPPNPIEAFKVKVPTPLKRRAERDVLTLDEQAHLQRGTLERKAGEGELTCGSRYIMQMFGLLAAFRDQEAAGIWWSDIDLDGRMIYVRHVWRRNEGIVYDTKTGKRGFGEIPLSPPLHAGLLRWQDLLRARGYPGEGNVPVLRTLRSEELTSKHVEEHWEYVCSKLGWLPEGKLRHTYYALRHTAANLWRGAGLGIDEVQRMMRHTRAQTTLDKYTHFTPEFSPLGRDVEDLGFERTPAGIIDALGIVLVRRWREAGIEVECSLPRHMVEPGREPQRLLTGGNNVVELLPRLGAPAPVIEEPIRSLEALRRWQRSEVHRLEALRWTNPRIAQALGIDPVTVAQMKRTPPDAKWMRKLDHATRAMLRQQIAEMRAADPKVTTSKIAAKLNVQPSFVTSAERARGVPMVHPRRSWKYLKHEAALRAGLAAGKTIRAIARELGFRRDTGLRAFAEKLGLGQPQAADAEQETRDFGT